jgi:hypothetical protein
LLNWRQNCTLQSCPNLLALGDATQIEMIVLVLPLAQGGQGEYSPVFYHVAVVGGFPAKALPM